MYRYTLSLQNERETIKIKFQDFKNSNRFKPNVGLYQIDEFTSFFSGKEDMLKYFFNMGIIENFDYDIKITYVTPLKVKNKIKTVPPIYKNNWLINNLDNGKKPKIDLISTNNNHILRAFVNLLDKYPALYIELEKDGLLNSQIAGQLSQYYRLISEQEIEGREKEIEWSKVTNRLKNYRDFRDITLIVERYAKMGKIDLQPIYRKESNKGLPLFIADKKADIQTPNINIKDDEETDLDELYSLDDINLVDCDVDDIDKYIEEHNYVPRIKR